MAKYFRWNPDRGADATFSGSVTKRFLKLDSKPNRETATSKYYKVDDPASGNSTLITQDKSTGKPQKLGPISDSDLASKIAQFTNNSTKRNHCLSEWYCMRTGSARFTMPLGGYLWKVASGTTSLYQSSAGTPYGANKQANAGELFFATEGNTSTSTRTPLHVLRDGDTGSMVPKSLAGTQFGFYTSRYSGSNIVIRGLGSLSGSSPLIVVDGIEQQVSTSDFDLSSADAEDIGMLVSIAPEDIKEVKVTDNGAATSE